MGNAAGLNYFGLLRSFASWAKVAREILLELAKQGDDINIYERRGFGYKKDFELGRGLEKTITKKFIFDNTLTFEYPMNYRLIKTKKIFGMLVYETTKLPEKWVAEINKHLNLLFVPSFFNKEIFNGSGVKPDIIRVLPHGINPKYYFKNKKKVKKDVFRFLTVSMPQKRKALDILLPVFMETFAGRSDIELTVKMPYLPGKSIYDFTGIKEYTDAKNIKFVSKEYSEEQMGDLYRSSDCYVQASRAEGFGMTYLEALACGLPVIATGWGGHMDFLNEKNAELVKYKLVSAKGVQYDNNSDEALMAEPDVNDLAEKIKYVYENHDVAGKKADELQAGDFYWENIVGKLKQYIMETNI